MFAFSSLLLRRGLGLLFGLALSTVVVADEESSALVPAEFDLVIQNGRVMDPASGLDAIRHLAIRDGRIAAISDQALKAREVIDARGLVVAPGFIDLHAHGQDADSNRFQVTDGITTALELEIGVLPLEKWLAERAGRSRVNYGASAGHPAARFNLVHRASVGNIVYREAALLMGGEAEFARSALDAEGIDRLLNRLEAGLDEGALGIGLGIAYTPGASREEIYRVFELAASRQVPVFVHMREAGQESPLAPLQEVLANAAITGAALHVVHLNSSTDTAAALALEMIRDARQRGLDVTTEFYPYTAGSTRLDSALFDDFAGPYDKLQWTATGERLTAETFREYRQQGGWVILHGQDPVTNRWLAAQPEVIVASDGVPFVDGQSHPRSAGTFARVLGHYVREQKALDLMTALRKMTLLPARRLETIAPAMARKGRLQTGADADLTIFDPKTINDRATFREPAQASAGIVHVLVGGVAVVRNSQLVEDAYPGKAIRSLNGHRASQKQ